MTDAEALIEHIEFVRGIARALLRDEHAAEDVTQEVYAVALKRPPRGSNPRGWLRRVTSNLSLMHRRGEGRRARRHRVAAAREPDRATDEVVARIESQRKVVAALLEVPEPFRAALLLRFYEELTPRAIARQLDVPVATVRSRIRRGLQHLRAGLLRSWGNDRRALHLTLVGLALARPAGAGVPILGVLTMKKSLAAGVLIAAGLVALVTSNASTSAERTEPRRTASLPAQPEQPTGDSEPSPPGEPASDSTRLHDEGGAEAEALLHVRLNAPAPLRPGSVRLVVFGGNESIARTVPAASVVAFKAARLPGHAAQRRLLVDHPAYLPERVPLKTPETAVNLVPAGAVEGTVLDGRGVPLAGAEVGVFSPEGDRIATRPVESTITDESGRFRLRSGLAGEHLVVARHEKWAPGWTRARIQIDVTRALTPIRLISGSSISGRVHINGAPPALPVELTVIRHGEGSPLNLARQSLLWTGSDVVPRFVRGAPDAAGNYAFRGLARGPHELRVAVRVAGGTSRDAMAVRTVEAPAPQVPIDFALAEVRFVVRDGGRRLGGIFIGTEREGNRHTFVSGHNGEVVAHLRPRTAYRIRVEQEGFTPHESRLVSPPAGARIDHEVALVPGVARASLRVTLQGQAVPAKATLALFTEDGALHARITRPVHNGRLEWKGLEPGGRYRLVVRPGSSWHGATTFQRDASTDVVLTPGQRTGTRLTLRRGGRLTLDIRSPDGRTTLGDVTCRVRDAGGSRVPVSFVKRTKTGWFASDKHVPWTAGPTAVQPALAAGRYVLEITAPDGFADQRVEVEIVEGKSAVAAVVLRPR